MVRFRDPFSGRFLGAPGTSPPGTRVDGGAVERLTFGSGWVPNPAFTSEMRRDPAMQAELRAAAMEVARVAEANIHMITRQGFMPRPGTPLVVVQEDADGGVIVLNTDHGGHLYEWGSIKTPPYAPMRRAVRAVGLKFAEASVVRGGL